MLKDPLIRRFISASFFAGAFIWVAVRYFNVEADVVWVLFLFSIAFVVGLMVIGLVLAPLVRLFRRDSSPMLSSLEAPEQKESAEKEEETTRNSTSE